MEIAKSFFDFGFPLTDWKAREKGGSIILSPHVSRRMNNLPQRLYCPSGESVKGFHPRRRHAIAAPFPEIFQALPWISHARKKKDKRRAWGGGGIKRDVIKTKSLKLQIHAKVFSLRF